MLNLKSPWFFPSNLPITKTTSPRPTAEVRSTAWCWRIREGLSPIPSFSTVETFRMMIPQYDTIFQGSALFFSTTRTWPAERHQRNWSTSNAGNSSHVWLLEDRTVAVQNMVCWRYGMFLPIPRHEWLYTYQVVLAWLLYGIQDNWWQCKTYRGGR